jgi:putative membrane protein
MKRITLLFSICMILVFVTSCDKNNDNNSNSLNSTDQNFMTMAAFSNNDEIDFAKLALTKSSNDSVKMFAQMMIADHTKATMGLDSLAGKYSVTLPTTIDSIHAALKTSLMALSGFSFDSSYVNGQVKDHMNAISLFQNEVNGGNNQDVKNFASGKLPVLQMHLQMANSLVLNLH